MNKHGKVRLAVLVGCCLAFVTSLATPPAAVLAVEPCPPIQAGPGRLVTGTFAHQSADVLDLHVAGLDQPVGVTAAHPFWSDDRQDFVPAGMLRAGERLAGLDGPARVACIVPRASPQRVYNLEVDVEHVYYVTGRGLLVHNNYLRGNLNKAGIFGGADDVAHHIIPVGKFSNRSLQVQDALKKAQGILRSHRIDMHCHWNGVFLPSKAGTPRSLLHGPLHTDRYILGVTARLQSASKMGKARVLRELRKIKSKLLDGTLKF